MSTTTMMTTMIVMMNPANPSGSHDSHLGKDAQHLPSPEPPPGAKIPSQHIPSIPSPPRPPTPPREPRFHLSTYVPSLPPPSPLPPFTPEKSPPPRRSPDLTAGGCA